MTTVVALLEEACLPGGFRPDLLGGGLVDMVVQGTGAGVPTVDAVVLVPLGEVSADTVEMMDFNEVVAEDSGMEMAMARVEVDLTTDEEATGTETPDLTTIGTTLTLPLEVPADPVIGLDVPRPMSDDLLLVVALEAVPSPDLDPTLVRLLLDPEGGVVDPDPARAPSLARCPGAGVPRGLDPTRGAFRGPDPDHPWREERGEPRRALAGVEAPAGVGARSGGREELAQAGAEAEVPVEAEAGAEARSRPSELRRMCTFPQRDQPVTHPKSNKTMVEQSTSLLVFSCLRLIERNTRGSVAQSRLFDR